MGSGRLAGKTIVLAGAGGIGDHVARHYVEEGANVVLADLRGDHARAVAAAIDPAGVRIVGTDLEGTDEASAAAMVALAVSRFGRLDGLHLNFTKSERAGMGFDVPLDLYHEVMNVTALGYLVCTRAAVPAMIAAGGGAIVYMSSAVSYSSGPDFVVYQMAKSAINAFTRATASSFGEKGIRANAIAPGLILHDRHKANMSEAYKADAMAQTALKTRLGDPLDIAATSAFLLSDAAGYISGQLIAVDGGFSMRQ